jgi:hypothetical protein
MGQKKRTSKKNKSNKTSQDRLAYKVRRLASEAIDIYQHGIDATGRKGIIFVPTQDKINETRSIPFPKRPTINDTIAYEKWVADCKHISMIKNDGNFKTKDVLKHINGYQMQYYCNSQYKNIFWMGFDIDNDTKDLINIVPWHKFLFEHFPDVWADHGSSGNSLHVIIRFEMTPLRKYFDHVWLSKGGSNLTYSSVANEIILSIKHIIKLYGHIFIDPSKQVELCGIKGQYSHWVGDSAKYAERIDKSGTLFTFPLINTESHYNSFKNSPIYSITDIINFSIYLSSILVLSNVLTLDQEQAMAEHTERLIAVLSVNGIEIPPVPVKKVAPIVLEREKERGEKSITLISSNLEITPPNDSKNDDCFGGDSIENERAFCRIYRRQQHKAGNENPTVEHARSQYIEKTGYSKHDSVRLNRFKQAYDFTDKTFDPSKLRKPCIYVGGDYVKELQGLYNKAKLKQMQHDIDATFTGRITHEDIAVAAGFYFVGLTRLLMEKQFSGKVLTLAQNNMVKWFKEANTKRTANPQKVKILRRMLIRIGWLKCVNEAYFTGKYSRRHIMTKAFPRYNEFEKRIGKDAIADWMTIVQEDKQVG